MQGHPPLELRFFGPLSVERGGRAVELPQSKKTRALLAYLVITGREHRRDRLCQLLWDVVDDPRGALRWSLSKLRRVVDDDEHRRLHTTRDAVRLELGGARVDLLELRAAGAHGLEALPTERLIALAEAHRGELLEGLELPDFHEFQAWCVAERSQANLEHQRLLATLVDRLHDEPARALPFARAQVLADPLDATARCLLLRLLVELGRGAEAEEHLQAGLRLAAELGAPADVLHREWQSLRHRPGRLDAASPGPPGAPAASPPASAPPATLQRTDGASPLIGRELESEQLARLFDEVTARATARVAIIAGEPGIGKSRLLDELVAHVTARGATVLRGRAFELEINRPYGPWRDAVSPARPEPGAASEGQPDLWRALDQDDEPSRERLFTAVVDRVATLAEAAPVLLAFDDVQWLDRDSAELLHYVARTLRQRPLLMVLSTRIGEIDDNSGVISLLRSLRRGFRVSELRLGRLGREATGALAGVTGEELDAVYRASLGNPLFALEIARARRQGLDPLSTSVIETVRERLERVPAAATDVLRWAAVLGPQFDLDLLDRLLALEQEELVDCLELLERHGLIALGGGGRGAISHDIVRAAVYGGLSSPRRRLMHRKVAELLAERSTAVDEVAQLAHHALQAGEARLAVSACVAAGKQALRMFAHADAEALARRGLSMVDELPAPERVAAAIDLLHVRYAARPPADAEAGSAELQRLAQAALDQGLPEHARLAFHMLAYLRWERGAMAEARRHMLEAERVSRSTDAGERAVALAEAARCLVLLERDLPQAEAFALEAEALSRRAGVAPSALPCALGMLQAHRGEVAEAEASFRAARHAAEAEGDRSGEFRALEALAMLEIDRGAHAAAAEVADQLLRLGERVGPGSEAAMARALVAFGRFAQAPERDEPALAEAVAELRDLDAKYRLAFVCTRGAVVALAAGKVGWARALSDEALAAARAVDRPTEVALAAAALARAAVDAGEPVPEAVRDELRACRAAEVSVPVRALIQNLLPSELKEGEQACL